MKFVIGGALVAIIVGYLGVMAFNKASVYYMTVPEVMTQKASISDRDVRVDGWVKAGSIQYEPQQTVLTFNVTDQDHNYSFPVVYKGLKPDNFEDPQLQVIVEGRFDNNNVFQASTLLTRCPSKYEDKPADTTTTSQAGQ